MHQWNSHPCTTYPHETKIPTNPTQYLVNRPSLSRFLRSNFSRHTSNQDFLLENFLFFPHYCYNNHEPQSQRESYVDEHALAPTLPWLWFPLYCPLENTHLIEWRWPTLCILGEVFQLLIKKYNWKTSPRLESRMFLIVSSLKNLTSFSLHTTITQSYAIWKIGLVIQIEQFTHSQPKLFLSKLIMFST